MKGELDLVALHDRCAAGTPQPAHVTLQVLNLLAAQTRARKSETEALQKKLTETEGREVALLREREVDRARIVVLEEALADKRREESAKPAVRGFFYDSIDDLAISAEVDARADSL